MFPDEHLIAQAMGCLSVRGWWHRRGGHAEVCLAHSPFMVHHRFGSAIVVRATELSVVERGTSVAGLGVGRPTRKESGEFCLQEGTEATGAHSCLTLHGAATVQYLV